MFADILRKLALTAYRMVALVSLYAVLAGVLGYTAIVGFYAVNTSWIAPVIVSPSDDKTLDLVSRLVTSENTLEDLKLDVKRLNAELEEMKQHRAAIASLRPELDSAIAREQAHNRATGFELAHLNAEKKADNLKTLAVLKQIYEVETQIDKDLSAGLITKGEAALAKTELNQQRNAYTDGKISEVLLRDSVLQKSAVGTQSIDVLDKRAELASQIAQLDIQMSVSMKQVQTEQEQIARLSQAIEAAKRTPYYLATQGGKPVHFAFIPYDNKSKVFAGTAVYDCYLGFVACRYVGTIKQTFSNEEKATNPIFHTEMRGFFAQLELEHPESATSKTLIVDRKPLFF